MLGGLDVVVERNSFGRQRESFETDLNIPKLGEKPFRGVFIRSPSIRQAGQSVEVLCRLNEPSRLHLPLLCSYSTTCELTTMNIASISILGLPEEAKTDPQVTNIEMARELVGRFSFDPTARDAWLKNKPEAGPELGAPLGEPDEHERRLRAW